MGGGSFPDLLYCGKSGFPCVLSSSYPDGAALSGLRHHKGAYLYFSGTVRKGVAAESMRFFDGSVWGIFCLYAVCEGEKGKVCHGNLAVAAALILIVYIYRMVTEFPGYPPMTFRRDNILNRIFPFYNDFLRHLFGI